MGEPVVLRLGRRHAGERVQEAMSMMLWMSGTRFPAKKCFRTALWSL